jgi:hypothetical protein
MHVEAGTRDFIDMSHLRPIILVSTATPWHDCERINAKLKTSGFIGDTGGKGWDLTFLS